jgi:diacylglycerol kinase family enzyme
MADIRHLFVLNPGSFLHTQELERVINLIHQVFQTPGNGDHAIHISRFPRDATGFVSSYAQSLAPEITLRVYAVGGDGILFDCLNGVIGRSNTAIGAVPYGQINSFVRGFGKKNSGLFRDFFRQLGASTVPMDVIHCGNNCALNFCNIGTASQAILKSMKFKAYTEEGGIISRWIGHELKDSWYYAGAVAACLSSSTLKRYYHVEIDGEDFSGYYRNIFIANGSCFHDHYCPAPAAMPNDGMMDVLFSRSANSLTTLLQLPFYLRGHYTTFPRVFFLKRARKISVQSKDPLSINLDDVAFFDPAFTAEIQPSAVQFIDPTGANYQGSLADAKAC